MILEDGCPRCARPVAICVCDRLEPMATKLAVLILQHPREQDVVLGTAKLLAMGLSNSLLTVGLSWASLAKAWGKAADPARWAVVFPSANKAPKKDIKKDIKKDGKNADKPKSEPSGAITASEASAARTALAPAFELVNRQGKVISPKRIRGIVLLDGSWSQAKSLWWRNPWLLKLHRLTLMPKEPSIYGSLRPEPRRQYVSTLEAAGAALTALGEPPELEAELRRVFRTLLQRFRDAEKGVGTHADVEAGGGRALRLKKRRRTRASRPRAPTS